MILLQFELRILLMDEWVDASFRQHWWIDRQVDNDTIDIYNYRHHLPDLHSLMFFAIWHYVCRLQDWQWWTRMMAHGCCWKLGAHICPWDQVVPFVRSLMFLNVCSLYNMRYYIHAYCILFLSHYQSARCFASCPPFNCGMVIFARFKEEAAH